MSYFMMGSFRLLPLFVLIALIAACAGPVPKIDTSADKLSKVKTIAVIRPPEPKIYNVTRFGDLRDALHFSNVFSSLITRVPSQLDQERLSHVFKAQGTAFMADLADRIAAKLVASGFEARVEDAPWEEVHGGFDLPFEKINSTADAILVVSPSIVGFISTGPFSDYVPTIAVVVTLVGKDRKEPLYRGFHSSGWAPKSEGWKVSPPKITFSNLDTLMSDTEASAAALDGAERAITESVNADLPR